MSEETLYLMEIGSKKQPPNPTELYIQPMTGSEDHLHAYGEPFWIQEEVFKTIVSGNVIAPENGQLPVRIIETGVTCPRRAGVEQIPYSSGQDYWYKQGPDRKCSFCGSIHPDDLHLIIDDMNSQVILEASKKNYKVYIRRPGIINAGFGAIKWYVWHGDDILIEKVNARLELQFADVCGNG